MVNAVITAALYGTATAYAWYYWQDGSEYSRGVNIGATLAAGAFYAVSANIAGLTALCKK